VVIDMWRGEEYTGCLSHKLTNFAKNETLICEKIFRDNSQLSVE